MTTSTFDVKTDFAKRHFVRGKAEGEAQGKAEGEGRAVLAVLAARGIEIPDSVRETITTCRDIDVLDQWIRRAVTATTIDDLFVDAAS